MPRIDRSTIHEAYAEDAVYLRFLVEAGEILSRSLDYHQTLRNVCTAAVRTVADICLLDLQEDGRIRLVAAAHREPERTAELLHAGRFLKGERSRPRHPVLRVIESGEALLVTDVDDDYIDRDSTSAEHARFMRELDYRSLVIVPVVSQTQGIVGALTLVRTSAGEERYDGTGLIFAQDLGRRCGFAIGKAQLYSQAVEISSGLQRSLLPRELPRYPGVSFDAYYEPAEREMLVGGDWYDAFLLPDGRIGMSIGDVSGHGVEAAAFMGSLRDALRALLYRDPDLSRALAIADYLVAEDAPDGMFATAHLAIVDPAHATLTCAAAGHPGPLVWNADSGIVSDPFTERGLPLGFRHLHPSVQTSMTLSLHRAFVVFFTDGLLEWNRDYIAGEAALYDAMRQARVRDAERPARAVRDAVVQGEHQDDLAILALWLECARTGAL
jgi:hypothetical protein